MARFAGILAVLAAVVVVASAAGAPANPSLTLMPLAKADLGPTAAALPLDPYSGVQTNAAAAGNATGNVTAAQLGRLGRLTGYAVDYDDAAGHALDAGHGLLDVQTEVDRYRSAAAARAGVAFWRRDDANISTMRSAGIAVSERFFAPAGMGASSFGMEASLTVPGKHPIYGIDIYFSRGALVGEVTVSAADSASRRAYAEGLAAKLARRIDRVVGGRSVGAPVALPPKVTAGPPANGPDLSKLAVTASDLGPVSIVKKQGYRVDLDDKPLSEYQRVFTPAGLYMSLEEQVALYQSATKASYTFASTTAGLGSKALAAQTGIKISNLRRVDVHAGDEGSAFVIDFTEQGVPIRMAIVAVRIGATVTTLWAADRATMTISDADVQALAKLAAKRVTSGLDA